MGILPKIDFVDYSKQDTTNNKNSNGKTFLIDFQKKKLLKSNGQLIKTDDERAVRMWIEKVLLTEKYKWNIYKIFVLKHSKGCLCIFLSYNHKVFNSFNF